MPRRRHVSSWREVLGRTSRGGRPLLHTRPYGTFPAFFFFIVKKKLWFVGCLEGEVRVAIPCTSPVGTRRPLASCAFLATHTAPTAPSSACVKKRKTQKRSGKGFFFSDVFPNFFYLEIYCGNKLSGYFSIFLYANWPYTLAGRCTNSFSLVMFTTTATTLSLQPLVIATTTTTPPQPNLTTTAATPLHVNHLHRNHAP